MSIWNNIEDFFGFGKPKMTGPNFASGMNRNKAAMEGNFDAATNPQSFEKGGPVKKTGIYKLHEGEYVLNRRKAAMAKKMGQSTNFFNNIP